MLDENWTPSSKYSAPLYFHCPNTNCDGHVKLQDRSRHHAIQCDKCSLEFAIGAAPEMRQGRGRSLRSTLEQYPLLMWMVFILGVLVGVLVGVLIGKH
jgi:hypothetical protein